MTLHILFCNTQAVDADGEAPPIASLALTLDDEVQFRCAGFIQAEIERYAEDVHDGTPAAEVHGSDDDSSGDELPKETNEKLTNGKSGKGHHPGKNGVTGNESFFHKF
jgi:cohesin complex subunit SA-1/2